jgi:hypothetical protein
MRIVIPMALLLGACATPGNGGVDATSLDAVPAPRPIPLPRGYVCARADSPPSIDGRLDEAAWEAAPWTEDFLDIRGGELPTPRFRTRAKMLWDDRFFYVAAEMEEPHVWATLTERDSIIFHDNDFEVFIDPDGDTHEYFELEVNAYGTDWDLFLVKPYRDGGPALHGWDIHGLVTEVSVDGTIDDPSDTDRGWSVEIAIPWEALEEAAHRPAPPEPGDLWRVNFSRVEWRTHIEGGHTVKDVDPDNGKTLPEDNWVWSPQGIVNMHYPETWGLVHFSAAPSGETPERFTRPEDLVARRSLRTLYFGLRNRFARTGSFEGEPLDTPTASGWNLLELHLTPSRFEAILTHRDGRRLSIDEVGRIQSRGGKR